MYVCKCLRGNITADRALKHDSLPMYADSKPPLGCCRLWVVCSHHLVKSGPMTALWWVIGGYHQQSEIVGPLSAQRHRTCQHGFNDEPMASGNGGTSAMWRWANIRLTVTSYLGYKAIDLCLSVLDFNLRLPGVHIILPEVFGVLFRFWEALEWNMVQQNVWKIMKSFITYRENKVMYAL